MSFFKFKARQNNEIRSSPQKIRPLESWDQEPIPNSIKPDRDPSTAMFYSVQVCPKSHRPSSTPQVPFKGL